MTEQIDKSWLDHRVETFLSLDEATMWLERALNDYDLNEWKIEEARIVYINRQWRAGYTIVKRQVEMFDHQYDLIGQEDE